MEYVVDLTAYASPKLQGQMRKRKTEIENGDEVVFLGKNKLSWKPMTDYGLLKEGEAYVVHFATPSEISIVGVPGLHDKSLFQLI